jgi:hypothetical protein
MDSFIHTFSFVPDDRLTWTPSPTAKSAIRIAAHTAVYAGLFADMINNRRLPTPEEVPGFRAGADAAEEALTSRVEMERVFRKNTENVLTALDSLIPDETKATLDFGHGITVPMTFLLWLPCKHALGHEGQIDFLQTCWDDQVVHF